MTGAEVRRRFNRDCRVIAARKQYRDDLRRGMPERAAWDRANAIFGNVRRELENRRETVRP